MSEQVIVERQGAVQVIRMKRPDKKNALTLAMYQGLAEALEQGDADAEVAVQVILGSGGSFCAGNDLADFLTLGRLAGTPLERFMLALSGSPKPLVAGVQGAAVGIGSTMLLHCDFVRAAPSAKFQFPFTTLGLVPEAGSSLLLPRLAGYQRAAELLMLGQPFTAETAVAVGLVGAILPDETLEAETLALAGILAAKPREAMRATKALLKANPEPVQDRIRRELAALETALQSPELKEAVAGFFQKKK